MENEKEKNDEGITVNQNGFTRDREKQKEDIVNKLHTASKVQELREVLNLLREKISLVERSIDRKDAHIRQL